VRRFAAKPDFEMELHAGLFDTKASAYVCWLRHGCQVLVRPQRFREVIDESFCAAKYLRAWVSKAQLRRCLEQTFGAE